jgi:hypothetical protein
LKKQYTVLLFDNGSLRPDATFALRAIAKNLSDRLGMQVEGVSLLHSHKIEADKLNGEPATIIRRRFKLGISNEEHHFICLPLFLGPSLAITEYLMELIEEAKVLCPEIEILVAPPLAGWDVTNPDHRLAQILAEQVTAIMEQNALNRSTNLVLVDHGSPIEQLSILRNTVTIQLQELLDDSVSTSTACSMERREGEAYAFNDPLLETISFDTVSKDTSLESLVVAMFFLLPGRHAGEGGDVDEILQDLVENAKIENFFKTDLIATHPLIYSILEDRVKSVLGNPSEA